MKWRRLARLTKDSAKWRGCAGSPTCVAPCQRNNAGRTSNKKATTAETGLPGRPNRNFCFQRPKTKGLPGLDRKSTRLNSSHQIISYAVFCLKKKKKERE